MQSDIRLASLALTVAIAAGVSTVGPVPSARGETGRTVDSNGVEYVVTTGSEGAAAWVVGFQGAAATIVIPPMITVGGSELAVVGIASNAFRGSALMGVQLPHTLTTIREDAFRLSRLESITIPANVTTIGNRAFSGNPLVSLEFESPSALTMIGDNAFSTARFTNVKIPASVTLIGDSAFSSGQLVTVDFEAPSQLIEIRDRAFSGNDLTTLTLPENLKRIGDGSFGGNRLTSLQLPDSIEIIERNAFQSNLLKSVDFPSGLVRIEDGVFAYNLIETLSIPSTLTSIGPRAFRGNRLSHILIPDTVTSVGASAFAENRLQSANLPGNTVHVSYGVFADNELSSFDVPESVTSIGALAFSNNMISSVDLPDGLLSIQDSAFSHNRISTIEFPESLTEIGPRAFSFNQLSAVSVPSGVTIISNAAFLHNALTSVAFPAGTSTIEALAFSNNLLEEVQIPQSVRTIGASAFESNLLSEVDLPSELTFVGSSAFAKNQLLDLVVPEGLRSVGSSAFRDNQLRSVVLPSTLEVIDNSAFAGNNLTHIEIPVSLRTIGAGAFRENRLTELAIPSTIADLGAASFANNRLTSLTLPETLEVIPAESFRGNLLEDVRIPASVEVVQAFAFAENPLQTVRFDGDRPNMSSRSDGAPLGDGAGLTVIFRGDASGFTYPQMLGYDTKSLHRVFFMPNGGSGVMNPVTILSGDPLPFNSFEAPESRYFAEWTRLPNGTGTRVADGAASPFGHDVVLYARWSRNPIASIVLTGPTAVKVGDSASYSVEGFDASGNSLGDVSAEVQLSGPRLSVDGTVVSFLENSSSLALVDVRVLRATVVANPVITSSLRVSVAAAAPNVGGLPNRVSGQNRYETGAAIGAVWDQYFDASTVFVATGESYPDALAGSAVAANLGAPLLLTARHALPDVVRTRISSLQPSRIIVLGGPGAVDEDVLLQLGDIPGVTTVERWFGANRYETGNEIIKRAFGVDGDGDGDEAVDVDTIVVATGSNFPDALSAGPAVASVEGAVLLVPGTSDGLLSASIDLLHDLNPRNVVIVGSAGAVSAGIESDLRREFPGAVIRLGGTDRYETSARITEHFFRTARSVFISVGSNFPDALAGGALAGALSSPLITAQQSCVPRPVLDQIRRFGPTKTVLVGGSGVLSDKVGSLVSC